MSNINIIAAMQSSVSATTGKFTTSQTATTQHQPAANTSSVIVSKSMSEMACPYQGDITCPP